MHNIASRLLVLLGACLIGSVASAEPDLVLINANVYTVDADRPRAQAIAIEDGRIVGVGSDLQSQAWRGEGTRVIDLDGASVFPGFIDAHGHMIGLGSLETGVVDLAGTNTYEEMIDRVVARANDTPAGTWIIGHGWDHESWPSRELPGHRPLSEAIPDHPVWLSRVDGHAALANQAAMTLAEVDEQAQAPAGGEIIRDADGSPSGVFIDNAESLVARVIPASATPRPEETLLAAQRLCFEAGLTGLHDMGIDPSLIDLYHTLNDNGSLKIRINAMVAAPFAPKYFNENEPTITETLVINGVKVYLDGAMGSRGAWLLEPYNDRPTSPDGSPYTGLAVSDLDTVRSLTRDALRKGYQVCAHAIGDRANRELLDIFEETTQLESAPSELRRWRIEHAQLLSPSDIPRFAELGIIASMQPTHCTSDMRWVADRVGDERAEGAYAWGDLLRSGAIIAAGSDFPVESHNPLLGFYAAITRQNAAAEPSGGWNPEQRMTRTEALRSMTLDAAYAGFREQQIGSLTRGKLADLVVLDTDIMTCKPTDILEAKVLMTMVGGEIVYSKNRD